MGSSNSDWIPKSSEKFDSFTACCNIAISDFDSSELPIRAVGIIRHENLFVRLLFNQRSEESHFHFDFTSKAVFKEPPKINSSLEQINDYVRRVLDSEMQAKFVSTFYVSIDDLPPQNVIALLSSEDHDPEGKLRMSEAKFVFGDTSNALKWFRDGDRIRIDVESSDTLTLSDKFFDDVIDLNYDFYRAFLSD